MVGSVFGVFFLCSMVWNGFAPFFLRDETELDRTLAIFFARGRRPGGFRADVSSLGEEPTLNDCF